MSCYSTIYDIIIAPPGRHVEMFTRKSAAHVNSPHVDDRVRAEFLIIIYLLVLELIGKPMLRETCT